MSLWGERRPIVTFAVAAICLSVFILGTGTGGVPANSAGPSAHSPGARELASAVSAIQGPGGPDDGTHVACAALSTTTESCGPQGSNAPRSLSGFGWSNITSSVVPLPSPRFSTMVWDASDGYVLLYGAFYLAPNDSAQEVKDTWSYQNGTWTNLTTEVTGGPPPTPINPIMTFDPWSDEVVLFGGSSTSSGNLSLTWTYHALVWTNITPTAGTPPSPRWLPVFVPDLATHQMILYGGESVSNDHGLDDTWLFSGTAWSNISGSVGASPPDLALMQGLYDPAESGILLLGTNYAGPPYVGNVFLFTGGTWHNLTSSEAGNVPNLAIPALGYVAATSTVLAVASLELLPGTGEYAYYPVEWAFHSGNWTNVTALSTVPGSGSAATVATLPSGALLMYGGEAVSTNLTQWMYAYTTGPTDVQITASPAATDVGLATDISASYSGGLAPYTTSLKFGDGSSVNGTLSTSHRYASPGTETIEFNVTDLTGQSASASTTLRVNASLSGLSISAAPSTASVGATVNFTPTVTGGTPPYTSAWSFGDGGTATTDIAPHSFAKNGTFEVHLVLTDAAGATVNTSIEFIVTPATSPATGTSATALYLIVGVVVAAVLILAVILLVVRRRRPPPPQTQPSATVGATVPPGPLGNPVQAPPNPPPAPPPSGG